MLVLVGFLVVDVDDVPVEGVVNFLVEAVVVAPIETGSPRLLTGLVVIPLEPGRCSSSSSLAFAVAPSGRVRLLGWVPIPRPRFLVLNLDQA